MRARYQIKLIEGDGHTITHEYEKESEFRQLVAILKNDSDYIQQCAGHGFSLGYNGECPEWFDFVFKRKSNLNKMNNWIRNNVGQIEGYIDPHPFIEDVFDSNNYCAEPVNIWKNSK